MIVPLHLTTAQAAALQVALCYSMERVEDWLAFCGKMLDQNRMPYMYGRFREQAQREAVSIAELQELLTAALLAL